MVLPGVEDGGDPLDHLGEERLRRREVEPERPCAAGAEGWPVHDTDARPVSHEYAGRLGEIQRRTVQPGEIGAVGRPVAHRRKLPAEQAAQKLTTILATGDDLVQPRL